MSDSSGNVIGEIGDMVVESTTSSEFRSITPSGWGGAGCLIAVLVVLVLAVIGIALLSALLDGGSASPSDSIAVESDTASSVGQEGTIEPSPENGVDWIPRDGTWEIENLPFLPECGPGSLGSGFEEGTIEVLDEGASIIASGSEPGTASIELLMVDAAPGRLEYLGLEPTTGIEMTMVFTSPTDMQASVRFGGEICLERPATGSWDREIGEPDPDAEEDEALPAWMPAGFPTSSGGQVNTIETPASKTVVVVVPDTHPTDVLFSIAEWAVDEGHPILERSATTLTIDLPENQVMYVEVIDLGNFNTQLTVTIETS